MKMNALLRGSVSAAIKPGVPSGGGGRVYSGDVGWVNR